MKQDAIDHDSGILSGTVSMAEFHPQVESWMEGWDSYFLTVLIHSVDFAIGSWWTEQSNIMTILEWEIMDWHTV